MKEYLFKGSVHLWYAPDAIDWQIINEEQKKQIENAIEYEIRIYFGELSGKHSEVVRDINQIDIEIVDDLEQIGLFKKLHGERFGNRDIVGDILEELEAYLEEANEA